MQQKSELDCEIRKLRKKLRQIEKLERSEQELTESEKIKISRKCDIRGKLQNLLSGNSEASSSSIFLPNKNDLSNSSSFVSSELDSEIDSTDNNSDKRSCPDDSLNTPEHPGILEETRFVSSPNPSFIPSSSKTEEIQNKMTVSEISSKPTVTDDLTDNQSKTEQVANAKSDKTHSCALQSLSNVKTDSQAQTGKSKKGKRVTTGTGKGRPRKPVSSEHSISQVRRKAELKIDGNCCYKVQDNPKSESLADRWKRSEFLVRELEGHNGIVTTVALVGNLLLTGSQDTTLKLWDIGSGEIIRTMSGHTNTVTSVVLLDAAESLADRLMSQDPDDFRDLLGRVKRVGVSVSLDCCIKFWHLDSGRCIRSIYTFNPLTCLQVDPEQSLVFTGSGGGKLEVWDLRSELGSPASSILAHEDSITALVLNQDGVYCSSTNGLIRLYEFDRETTTLKLLFNSMTSAGSMSQPIVSQRRINCMSVNNRTAYYGDDGINVKALSLQTGQVRRLTNHITDFGKTNCITTCGPLLLTSGYDLDNGYGYINVRSTTDEQYLCSLCDQNTSHIESLTGHCDAAGRNAVIITGGAELKVWTQVQTDQLQMSNLDGLRTCSAYVPQFDGPARNSESEMDSDFSESDPEDHRPMKKHAPLPWQKSEEIAQPSGWFSWCSIL